MAPANDYAAALAGLSVEFIDSTEDAVSQLAVLDGADAVAIDTETVYDGVDTMTHTLPTGEVVERKRDLNVDGPGPLRVVSVAARFGDLTRVWVLDARTVDVSAVQVLGAKRPYGWNAPFDSGVLARVGLRIRRWWDVMLIDAVLSAGLNGSDSSRYSSLAAAAKREFGIELGGKDSTRLSYDATSDLTTDQVRYAAYDAVVTLWLGDALGARARSLGLADTVVRECNAAPLITQMTTAGLPIDVEAYLDEVVRPASSAAAAAAEQLAVLTTGRTLLSTVAAWAASKGEVVEDEVEVGLSVLHSSRFLDFLDDVRTQAGAARERVAAALGCSQVSDDLFSDSPSFDLPFVIDDDNDLRRWLSSVAPVFASAVVASTLNGISLEQAEALYKADLDAFATACAGKKRIVKAHDLDKVVLPGLASTTLDVPDSVKAAAKAVADYRRFSSILTTYSHASVPVRLTPDWNVGSADAVKQALNTFDTDRVQAYFAATEGKPRLLVKADSVDSDTLSLIGGPLATALLEFRKSDKIVTTYGEEFLKFVHPVTGRIHARYKQALTGTGRLSSEAPNAQNLPPVAKRFLRPADSSRVLVAADLSQAELRYVADQSGDEAMLSAFANGEDLHTRTATLMFGVDLVALKASSAATLHEVDTDAVSGFANFVEKFCTGSDPKVDPARSPASLYKELRQKAKRVAFGYAYGLKGGSLATQLSVDGVPTSKEEADELLALFDTAYPAVAAWMAERVSTVESISSAVMGEQDLDVDFVSSWSLHTASAKVKAAATALRAKLGYAPSAEEISMYLVSDEELATRLGASVSSDEVGAARAQATEKVEWVQSYSYPSVLRKDGSVWMFSSRTAGGRVRWFPVLTSDWEWGMVTSIVRSRDSKVAAARDAWVSAYNAEAQAAFDADRAAGKVRRTVPTVTLYKGSRTLFGRELEKQFEDRTRRTSLVSYVLKVLPSHAPRLFRAGMADRVRAATNQFRNHPVQGGVADAMLVAMANIDEALVSRFPTAVAIQSVHDSLVVECDVADAAAIRDLMVEAMQEGLRLFCPSVVPLADADVQVSLDDKSALSVSDLEALAAS